ncbi:hypothetical protein Aspvir_008333 [Aspergillus viridinutans]|uniref:DNA2/NAM7 helicase-like C-terminal domain-containing protein n=1 Tax=Aspergillus viridinutans TaxID=75553 RepID=A0A9P3C5G9_ASPVI|nr:uncharacterized protein Aspvir_008333 [Aspergillus viridinutans]GIK04254.1 hypothetical protein Aspvir_008333 [Aspergillus viridinutans]
MSSELVDDIAKDVANPPHTLDLITVLTPYCSQMHLYLNSFCSNHRLQGVRIHTVDSFQGCGSLVVVFDTTSMSRLQFLADPNRLTAGLSCARAGLYIMEAVQLKRPGTKDPGELRKISSTGHVLRHLCKGRDRTPIPDSWQPVIHGVLDGQLITKHVNTGDPMTSADVGDPVNMTTNVMEDTAGGSDTADYAPISNQSLNAPSAADDR